MILKRKIDIRAELVAVMTTVLLASGSMEAAAQVQSRITVSGTEPASSCISLAKNSNDTDIIVKFTFDEQANTLKVSLISYRTLFVFNEYVRYSRIFCCGVLKPQRLPYEVKVPSGGKFKSTPEFRKSIRQYSGLKNCHKYVFSRWISYEGLRPVPAEYSMLNDRIEQTFDIIGQRSDVKVILKDISILDPDGKEGHYRFVLDRNVNRSFDITILRDPCFGREKDIEAASAALANVSASLDSLKAVYGDGIAPNEKIYGIFNGMKAVVTNQFAKADTTVECECLKESYVKYNAVVDSISALDYRMPESVQEAPQGVDAERMLVWVRTIDVAVGKWLGSTDPVEKHDLEQTCKSILSEADAEIKANGIINAEQQDAYKMLKKAEIYYKTTCGK